MSIDLSPFSPESFRQKVVEWTITLKCTMAGARVDFIMFARAVNGNSFHHHLLTRTVIKVQRSIASDERRWRKLALINVEGNLNT